MSWWTDRVAGAPAPLTAAGRAGGLGSDGQQPTGVWGVGRGQDTGVEGTRRTYAPAGESAQMGVGHS